MDLTYFEESLLETAWYNSVIIYAYQALLQNAFGNAYFSKDYGIDGLLSVLKGQKSDGFLAFKNHLYRY